MCFGAILLILQGRQHPQDATIERTRIWKANEKSIQSALNETLFVQKFYEHLFTLESVINIKFTEICSTLQYKVPTS
jgi:hypothetical protein